MPKQIEDETLAQKLEDEVIDFAKNGAGFYDAVQPHRALTHVAQAELKLKVAALLRSRWASISTAVR